MVSGLGSDRIVFPSDWIGRICGGAWHKGYNLPKMECEDCIDAYIAEHTEFKKFDQGKTQWHLLPWDALKGATRALSIGATKYGEFNWRKCEDSTRYFNATMRHLVHHQQGQPHDKETGLPSLFHALASLLIYTALEMGKLVAPDSSDV